MKWYEIHQNNSGGYFITDDKVCQNLYIEAENEQEAKEIAESLGCYWDGVANGIDYSCCGDRWDYADTSISIDLEKINEKGVDVRRYESGSVSDWHKTYDKYEKVENPSWEKGIWPSYKGRIRFRSMEEYVQFKTDEYGFRNCLETDPVSRMYYHDGTVKDFFKER